VDRTTEPRRALPLAVRLVTIYALVVGAALLLVAALAVQLTRSELRRQLEARMTAVATSFGEGPAASVTSADQLADAARSWLQTQPPPADQAVVVRTADGELLSTRSGLALGDVAGSADVLASNEGQWRALDGPDGSVLTLVVPLRLDDADAGTLVVAASTAGVDAGVRNLLRQVLWACVAGFVLAMVLGLLALRRVLRPLENLAADIDRLQASSDMSERVDVTGPADEVGRLALAFNRTLGRLQGVVASQRQFVADASHELRTPLTVARGQLELLGEDEAARDPDVARSLDIAVGELDRMGRMVRDLLLLARLDEGIDLHVEDVDLELVLNDAALRATPPTQPAPPDALDDSERGERPLAVEIDVPPGLTARADVEGVLQVVTNLIGNAIRHGGGSVGVAARPHPAEGVVVIAVADAGPGIAPEDVPHVFERFYRGSSHRDHDGGAGLGLAIAKGLAERMGGRIDVSTTPPPGTTFTVELPAGG
jgi:two-component system OmpR family sensor kinase